VLLHVPGSNSIPRNYKEAIEFDEWNGNTKWQDANRLEHGQLAEYEVFLDKGKFHEGNIPEGYCKIMVHTIFNVKHDGRKDTYQDLITDRQTEFPSRV
jgi:hypothetical protein